MTGTMPEGARNEQRLQKILSAAGVVSRRKAEELIVAGRVQVNGKVVTELGTKADAAKDHIRVDGKLITHTPQTRTFMLNKPKGVVTTASDPEGRETVMQFFPANIPRLFPVGRLDYQSEGLLLMTNDGELANILTNSASKMERTYLVKVSGKPTEDQLEELRRGIMIDRGRRGVERGRVKTQPAKIRPTRNADNPWYEVVLTEGKNREIRKMFEEIGHHVEKIRRVAFGPLVLDLSPGQARELTMDEVEKLWRAARARRRAAPTSNTPARLPKSGPSALPARRSTRTRKSSARSR